MTPEKNVSFIENTLLTLFALSVIFRLSNVKEFYMNTYFFRYETTIPMTEELILFKCRAKNLSFALRNFWLQSQSFLCPVKRLSTVYEVVNDKGKRSVRLLKDNVKGIS